MDKDLCRFCQKELQHTFLDLGISPLANSFIKEENLQKMEPFYPLHAYVCQNCYLVQLKQFESPSQIFSDYAYFSSFSESWLIHAHNYVKMAIANFNLTCDSQVVEIASNDGYLLQYFNNEKIPVLGIEPAENVAAVAEEKGIPTVVDFFGKSLSEKMVEKGKQADLIVANNVLAHVPDIHDFVSGLKILLKKQGVITIEFPHIMKLISQKQFDTIYHEHFSYFSLLTVKHILFSHGLKIFNVEQLPTHGGSLRIFVNHSEDVSRPISSSVISLIIKEQEFGIERLQTYLKFSEEIKQLKLEILKFFLEIKQNGKQIVGYGAPAKGNTLLNYCGVGKEFISYTVDRNIFKQGKYLPGTRIPIKDPEEIRKTKPDYLLILPWNLKEEIMEQNSFISEWGGRFIVTIPEIEVI